MDSDEGTDRRHQIRDLLIVGLIAALIILWAGISFFVIGDRPRTWDYGSQPFIPGASRASTERVPTAAEPPPQVELPPPGTKEPER